MSYIPKPLDSLGTVLPTALKELTESLAKNVHEVWAAGRMAAGWKYCPVKDEFKKGHACVIPSESLTEEGDDFGFATALKSIRFLLLHGNR